MEFSDQEIELIEDALRYYIANNSDDSVAIAESVAVKINAISGAADRFDPYTDPESRRMLERAGIATHRFR